MSETKGAAMSETAVERRLREMAHCPYCTDGYSAPGLPCIICEQRITADESAAIDAGREALALLREPLTAHGWRERRAALLARCEGEK